MTTAITMQGCPLTPLIFAQLIKPLAAAIRKNYNIIDNRSDNINHKISLHADNILLYIQNPEKSLTELITFINAHSTISDYSMNWNKSIIHPLNKNFESTKTKNN